MSQVQQGNRRVRQAPPRPEAIAARPAQAVIEDESGDSNDGDSNDGDSNDGAADKPKRQRESGIPTHHRKAGVFRRISDRLTVAVHGKGNASDDGTRTSIEMDGWVDDPVLAEARTLADEAIERLRKSAGLLESLGADFNPTAKRRRAASGTGKVVKGVKVKLRKKFRDAETGYGDLLTEEEMDNLTVQDVRGQKLVLLTPSGGKLFLPRSNVALVTDTDDDDNEGAE